MGEGNLARAQVSWKKVQKQVFTRGLPRDSFLESFPFFRCLCLEYYLNTNLTNKFEQVCLSGKKNIESPGLGFMHVFGCLHDFIPYQFKHGYRTKCEIYVA